MEFADFEERLADVRSSPSVAALPAEMRVHPEVHGMIKSALPVGLP